MNQKINQVFIAGCGPVGLSLAKCLASSPYIQSITLLDRKIPSSTRTLTSIPNQRVYSLNGPTLNLFNKLGIMQQIRNKGQMSQIQVVSKQSEQFFSWDHNNAQIVENDELVYTLMKNLQKNHSQKINFIEGQVESFQNNAEHSEIKIKGLEQKIKSKLIIGSDGNKSKIKQLAGINTYGWSYRQRGIVCTMQIQQKFPNSTGYQIYHDNNVLAILPLWGNYVSLVWSTNIPDFEHLMKLSEQQFRQKLNNVINNSNLHMKEKRSYISIPTIQKIINKRLSFPLSTLQASFYTGNRLALIGDAAHSIHPMAGLGVNSGILDSVFLANNIIKNIKTGNDIGDLMSLSQYQAQAKAFNYKNSLGMEGIKRAFQMDSTVWNYARKFGLSLFENSDSLKKISKSFVSEVDVEYEWQKI